MDKFKNYDLARSKYSKGEISFSELCEVHKKLGPPYYNS